MARSLNDPMKKFRVYFNRKREAPQVWSVDEGAQSSEVNLIGVFIGRGCLSRSYYNAEPANDNTPSAWLEISADGYLVVDGIARFFGSREPVDGRP